MTKVGVSLIAVDVDHSLNGLSLLDEHLPAKQHLSQKPRFAQIASASDEHGRGSGKYGESAAAPTVAVVAISVALSIANTFFTTAAVTSTTTTTTTNTTTAFARTNFIFQSTVVACGTRRCLASGIHD